MSELTPEAASEDVVEQREALDGERVPAGATPTVEVPFEADPADAVEQAVEVELDEDERR